MPAVRCPGCAAEVKYATARFCTKCGLELSGAKTKEAPVNMSVYLTWAELHRRWIYSKRGLRKLIQRGGFPEPFIVANGGRTKLWKLADIVAFETNHPEVTSEEAKHRKVAGYRRANLRKMRETAARA